MPGRSHRPASRPGRRPPAGSASPRRPPLADPPPADRLPGLRRRVVHERVPAALRDRRVLNQGVPAEDHRPPQVLAEGERVVRALEVRLAQALRDRLDVLGGVGPVPGVRERVLVDVGGVDLDAGHERLEPEVLRQDHRGRVRLLARREAAGGRRAETPGEQACGREIAPGIALGPCPERPVHGASRRRDGVPSAVARCAIPVSDERPRPARATRGERGDTRPAGEHRRAMQESAG